MQMKKAYEHSHYRFSQTFRLSPREWFYGFLRALPGGAGLLSPSPADNSADLTPASRRQDHTTSPYATESFAVETAASIASRAQRFVTMAKRPSCGHETAELVPLICPTAEGKYFLVWGLTRFP